MIRVALSHYWLTTLRGGEKVLLELGKLFPQSEIFTHSYCRESMQEYFGDFPVHETFIAKLSRRHCRKFLPLMPLALKKLDLSKFDLIISSESGPAKGVNKRPDACHICYCHTPMRYIWDMYDQYRRQASLPEKLAMSCFKNYLRREDLASAEKVDHFIANSHFVAERIKRIYHRPAEVINPPVDTDYFRKFAGLERKDFYLVAGQLTGYKNPELAISACLALKRKLVISGTGDLEAYLRKKYAGEELLTFTGHICDEELARYYGSCRGLIFPQIEDFGMVVPEAAAAGAGVIALGAGGALETVLDGETGCFFDRPDCAALAQAILRYEQLDIVPENCQRFAGNFSAGVFREKIRRFITQECGVRI